MGYQDSGNRSCAFHSGNLNSNTVNVKNNMLILHAATFPCLYQNNHPAWIPLCGQSALTYRCLQFPKNHWIRNTQYPS